MAGILDSKERLIDFVFTSEGKRQAATGQMRVEYATLTDLHTFYESNIVSGSNVASDASTRIYFEAQDRFQDTIVPELAAGTTMRPFRTSEFAFAGTNVISGSVRNGPSSLGVVLTGSDLLPESERAVRSLAGNFRDHRVLASEDLFSEAKNLKVYPESIDFNVRAGDVYKQGGRTGVANVELMPSIFADERFSHLPNFKFLPPTNIGTTDGAAGEPLGNYPKLREEDDYTIDELRRHLRGKQHRDVYFEETSRDNNLLCQWFESTPDGVEKLSVVDFGIFDEDEDPSTPPLHVFFVGRIIKDANGTETFANLFTVLAE